MEFSAVKLQITGQTHPYPTATIKEAPAPLRHDDRLFRSQTPHMHTRCANAISRQVWQPAQQ